MSVDTIIRRRTEEKELRMSREYVLSKDEFLALGAEYLGSLGKAAKQGYYTARSCECMGVPVTDDEWAHIEHFAMYKDCYDDLCLLRHGARVRPCLPVFYRGE